MPRKSTILPRWMRLTDASVYSSIGVNRLVKLAEEGTLKGFRDPDNGRHDWDIRPGKYRRIPGRAGGGCGPSEIGAHCKRNLGCAPGARAQEIKALIHPVNLRRKGGFGAGLF